MNTLANELPSQHLATLSAFLANRRQRQDEEAQARHRRLTNAGRHAPAPFSIYEGAKRAAALLSPSAELRRFPKPSLAKRQSQMSISLQGAEFTQSFARKVHHTFSHFRQSALEGSADSMLSFGDFGSPASEASDYFGPVQNEQHPDVRQTGLPSWILQHTVGFLFFITLHAFYTSQGMFRIAYITLTSLFWLSRHLRGRTELSRVLRAQFIYVREAWRAQAEMDGLSLNWLQLLIALMELVIVQSSTRQRYLDQGNADLRLINISAIGQTSVSTEADGDGDVVVISKRSNSITEGLVLSPHLRVAEEDLPDISSPLSLGPAMLSPHEDDGLAGDRQHLSPAFIATFQRCARFAIATYGVCTVHLPLHWKLILRPAPLLDHPARFALIHAAWSLRYPERLCSPKQDAGPQQRPPLRHPRPPSRSRHGWGRAVGAVFLCVARFAAQADCACLSRDADLARYQCVSSPLAP
jgi:hypothetical protein